MLGFGHGDGGAPVDEGGVVGGGVGDKGGVGEEGGKEEGGVLGEFDEFAGFGVGVVGAGDVGVDMEGGHMVDEFLFLVGGVGRTHGVEDLSGFGFVRGLSANEFFNLSSVLEGWSGSLEISILFVGVGQVDHNVGRVSITPMTSQTSS